MLEEFLPSLTKLAPFPCALTSIVEQSLENQNGAAPQGKATVPGDIDRQAGGEELIHVDPGGADVERSVVHHGSVDPDAGVDFSLGRVECRALHAHGVRRGQG